MVLNVILSILRIRISYFWQFLRYIMSIRLYLYLLLTKISGKKFSLFDVNFQFIHYFIIYILI